MHACLECKGFKHSVMGLCCSGHHCAYAMFRHDIVVGIDQGDGAWENYDLSRGIKPVQ